MHETHLKSIVSALTKRRRNSSLDNVSFCILKGIMQHTSDRKLNEGWNDCNDLSSAHCRVVRLVLLVLYYCSLACISQTDASNQLPSPFGFCYDKVTIRFHLALQKLVRIENQGISKTNRRDGRWPIIRILRAWFRCEEVLCRSSAGEDSLHRVARLLGSSSGLYAFWNCVWTSLTSTLLLFVGPYLSTLVTIRDRRVLVTKSLIPEISSPFWKENLGQNFWSTGPLDVLLWVLTEATIRKFGTLDVWVTPMQSSRLLKQRMPRSSATYLHQIHTSARDLG